MIPVEALRAIEAPMVDASDLPFRLMCVAGGATTTYTQMYLADRLLQDEVYREQALLDLHYERDLLEPEERAYIIVQLGGRDLEQMVQAGKLFEGLCDGLDINSGCPQTRAIEGGYGASFLAQKEWPHLLQLFKTRLCTPPSDTVRLALLLQEAGAAHITLHARFPSAKHRRHGAAQLDFVRDLKAALSIPVISNGNTSNHADFMHNLDYTGADGIMAGEGILKNPYIFAGIVRDPFTLTSEYLANCKRFPGSASPHAMRQHIGYFFQAEGLPKAWYSIVKKRLKDVEGLERFAEIVDSLRRPLGSIGDC